MALSAQRMSKGLKEGIENNASWNREMCVWVEGGRILMTNDRVGWDCVCTRACVGVGTTSVRTAFGEHT